MLKEERTNQTGPQSRGPALPQSDLVALQASLRGKLLQPGDETYDAARRGYNAMVDKHPALIVLCAGVSDVINAVNFARRHNLLTTVRGGGHSVAGRSTCDGGLVIDLSSMKGIRVDPVSRTARAEPGVTWNEFDRETQAFGLATTGGTISTTGIAGLTLGGGLGWLMRKHGLACDNLVSVDIVLADGRFLTASPSENADLFWGIRGAGANFGVVTSLEYRLHAVGSLLGGMLIYPLATAREVLQFYRDFTHGRRQQMYYRIAIQPGRDLRDRPSTWQWKSTVLSSLQSLFQVLRLYGALPQEHLRVFSSPSREGLEEQLVQENSGVGSASVTAAHFLQQRMIRSRGVTSACEARGHVGTTSIAVSTGTRLDESGGAVHVLDERSMSSLERRRFELELGTGGDHDVPYIFALPLSMPQVVAWTRLMGRVQRGEVEP